MKQKLQVCLMCGCVLTDYNGVFWLDGEGPGGGWAEGKNVFVSADGRFKTRELSPGTEFNDCHLTVKETV